ncbi:MAG: hypothetical protein ABSA83_06390 [Verrucomicrobiota bacterium]|jgi:hypothetical protein
MKQNAENSPVEVANQDLERCAVESPSSESSVSTFSLPTRRVRRSRPEVAVLGWKERFYRLALRESKA